MKAKSRIRHVARPGDIGYLTYLHGIFYAEKYGYDQTFEAYVAGGLSQFVLSFKPGKDRIWLAEEEGRIVGSITVVRRSRADAQLRWFLVDPSFQGQGIGRRLQKAALRFCMARKYETVSLWTTSELKEAGSLYARFGFRKTEEKTHRIWGKKVTEEKYSLSL